MSSSSCTTTMFAGSIEKKRANAATGWPERFMKVRGLAMTTERLPRRACTMSELDFLCDENAEPMRPARASATMNPTL